MQRREGGEGALKATKRMHICLGCLLRNESHLKCSKLGHIVDLSAFKV